MGKKGMVQWGMHGENGGGKPEKFSRVGYPFPWAYQVQLDAEKVERHGMDERGKIDPGFKKGDVVLCGGQIYRAGDVDPNGHWVVLGIHKHGTDIVKVCPPALLSEYLDVCATLGMEPV